jgi:hypothetical protein
MPIRVYYHYDEIANRLFASNVPWFPRSGIHRQARELVNTAFYQAQYERPDDPVRPFFNIHQNLFSTSALLSSLAFQPRDKIRVVPQDNGYVVDFYNHWVSLEAFLCTVCGMLGYPPSSDIPELGELKSYPWRKPAPSPTDAQHCHSSMKRLRHKRKGRWEAGLTYQ